MRNRRKLKNEINVVPYIDVMLVLLVIFMVTAPMMPTGNIDLPTVGTAATPPSGFDGWGAPLAKEYRTRGEIVKFSVTAPVTHLLIVLTEVGKSAACSTTNPYQGRINEVAFIPA